MNTAEKVNTPPPPYPGEPSGYMYPPAGNLPQNPPQYGFADPHAIPPPVMVTTTQPAPVVLITVAYGQLPMHVQCGHCRSTVLTETKVNPGGLSWLVFALCCIFGCWLGCCLIPFCVDSMQDVEHYCPNCKAKLGVYHRM